MKELLMGFLDLLLIWFDAGGIPMGIHQKKVISKVPTWSLFRYVTCMGMELVGTDMTASNIGYQSTVVVDSDLLNRKIKSENYSHPFMLILFRSYISLKSIQHLAYFAIFSRLPHIQDQVIKCFYCYSETQKKPMWVFPKIGVPQNGWFIMENPIKMDDLGVKPTILGNTHVLVNLCVGSRCFVNPFHA